MAPSLRKFFSVLVPDIKEKKRVLQEHLVSRLEHAKKHQLLELLASFCESNDDQLIKDNVQQIALEGILLSYDETHTLGSVLAKCEEIDYLKIDAANVSDDRMEIFNP